MKISAIESGSLIIDLLHQAGLIEQATEKTAPLLEPITVDSSQFVGLDITIPSDWEVICMIADEAGLDIPKLNERRLVLLSDSDSLIAIIESGAEPMDYLIGTVIQPTVEDGEDEELEPISWLNVSTEYAAEVAELLAYYVSVTDFSTITYKDNGDELFTNVLNEDIADRLVSYIHELGTLVPEIKLTIVSNVINSYMDRQMTMPIGNVIFIPLFFLREAYIRRAITPMKYVQAVLSFFDIVIFNFFTYEEVIEDMQLVELSVLD